MRNILLAILLAMLIFAIVGGIGWGVYLLVKTFSGFWVGITAMGTVLFIAVTVSIHEELSK